MNVEEYGNLNGFPADLWQKDETQMDQLRLQLLGISVIVSGTLYLVGIMVAGLVYGERFPVMLAVLGLGVNYIAGTVQIAAPHHRAWQLILLALSIVVGAWAGLDLLIGKLT